jgi:hypothetical protein
VSALDDLDQHLRVSDPDSMDWADGMGAEEAESILGRFHMADWDGLLHLWPNRDAIWRHGLADVLHPAQGRYAQRLLFRLAFDENLDVAFVALRAISFHCGVNSNADGVFFDHAIVHPRFVQRARDEDGLAERCEEVALRSSEHHAAVFRQLKDRLLDHTANEDGGAP